MTTPICPTCGCSLVRLGISKDKAVVHSHAGNEYYFCCDGCLEQFIGNPEKYLQDTDGLIVCPVCLTEKSLNLTRTSEFEGEDLYFCRCPLCMAEFNKNPGYYINRLAGEEDQPGTFKTACCPDQALCQDKLDT